MGLEGPLVLWVFLGVMFTLVGAVNLRDMPKWPEDRDWGWRVVGALALTGLVLAPVWAAAALGVLVWFVVKGLVWLARTGVGKAWSAVAGR